MASVFVLLEAFNRKEAAALGFFPCATASAQSTVVAFADDCQRVTHGIGYRINAMIATIRLAIETPKASHDCTSAMR